MNLTRTLSLIVVFLMNVSILLGQAPDLVNYQAVARDGAGVPLINTAVNVQFDIRQTTPAGTIVYTETHATSTNPFGLFTVELGGGTPVLGTFAAINWGTGLYYLQVTVNGDVMPSNQLLSVPYALHANTAATGTPGADGHDALADSIAEPAGANCPNGGYLIHMGSDDNDDGILQPLERDISYYICNGLDGAANNNDTSATNELQTLSISNDTIFLSNGGFVVLPTSAGDGDWQVTGNDMHSIPTGNVGIGTTTPVRKLEIETTSTAGDGLLIDNTSTGNPGVMFSTQGNPRFVMGVHQSDGDKFKIGTTNVFTNTRLTIDQTGNVGIGTINPLHRLTVGSADTVVASFVGANANGSLISIAGLSPTAPVGTVFLTGADSAVLGLDPNDKTFYLANTTQDGHVGVFADSSAALYGQVVGNIANKIINSADTIFNIPTSASTITTLNFGTFVTDTLYVNDVNAGNAGWVLTDNGFGKAEWQPPSGGGLWQSNAPDIYFNTGNVGIGTTTPTASLTIEAVPGDDIFFSGGSNADIRANAQMLLLANLGISLNSTLSDVRIQTANTDRINILNTGEVGIGLAAPTTALQVSGITTTDSLVVTDGAGIAGNVLTDDGTGNAVWAAPSSGVSSRIQDLDNNTWVETDILGTGLEDKIRFSLNGTERVIIDNNGLVGIGTAFPGAPLHIANGALGAAGSAVLMSNNTNPTNASSLSLMKSRGSEAVPAPIQQNDVIGSIDFSAYNTVSYDKAAGILVEADETFTSTAMGSHMEFHIAPIGMGPAQEAMRLSNAGWLGLGTTNPLVQFHVADETQTTAAIQASHNGPADQSGNLTFVRSRGSIATPTAVSAGDRLGKIEWVGYNSSTSNFEEKASIRVVADETYNSASTGSHMEFHINPMGQSTTVEAMYLSEGGNLGIGTGNPQERLHLLNGTLRIDDGANAYTLPPADGNNGEVLTTDGSGNVTWQPGGGGPSPWTKSGADIFQTTLTDFVGVGTNTPTEMLSIGSQGTATGTATQQSSHRLALTGSFWNGGSAVSHDFTIHNRASLSTNEEGIMTIEWTGTGTELFTLTSYGSIGFGITPGPVAKFATLSNNHAYVIEGTNVFGSSFGNTSYGVYGNSVGGSAGNNAGIFGNASGAAVDNIGVKGRVLGGAGGNAYGVKAEVDGSSAGTNYAFHGEANSTNGVTNYGIFASASGGTTNWAAFFANGDVFIGDGLVIPTNAGQGKVLTSDAAGDATWKVNAVAFETFPSNAQGVVNTTFGNTGAIIVRFDSEIMDEGGNNYDPNPGVHRFVAPVPGVYSIEAGITFQNLGGPAGQEVQMGLMQNGGFTPIKVVSVTMESGNGGTTKSAVISATIRMNAGDFVHVEAIDIGGSGTNINILPGESSWFSGHLIYAD